MRLEGKIAIVTGAGSGYGAETARRFAREGARIAIVDLREEAAQNIAREIGEDRAIAVACDVASSQSVADMVAKVSDRFGGFDILVNNAAITQLPKRVAKLPEVEIDKLFAVNVKSLYHMAVHACPVMRARGGGNVINIASLQCL